MAFLDKLSNIAKSAADKTSDMVETSKLNTKINESKSKIATCKTQIGEYCWAKYEAGDPLDPDIVELCATIKAELAAIEGYNSEIQSIKAATPQPEAAQESALCPSCGQSILPGKKFCPECGAPVVT